MLRISKGRISSFITSKPKLKVDLNTKHISLSYCGIWRKNKESFDKTGNGSQKNERSDDNL